MSVNMFDQIEVSFEELEIWCPERRDYFGTLDVAAVVDIVWDTHVSDVGWYVSDWLVYSPSGSRRSVGEMSKSSAFWVAMNKVLAAQIPSVTERIDDEVSERHSFVDANAEHRLPQSAFL